jgi:hypothetical protein
LSLKSSSLRSSSSETQKTAQSLHLPTIDLGPLRNLQEGGNNSTASLPLGIPDSAFGPKLMGLLAALTGVLHVAKREAIQLIKDFYDIRGKKFIERVTTVTQTVRKHSGNALRFIQRAVECFYSRILPSLISESMGF